MRGHMDKKATEIIQIIIQDKRRMKIKIRNLEDRIESLERLIAFRKGGSSIIPLEKDTK